MSSARDTTPEAIRDTADDRPNVGSNRLALTRQPLGDLARLMLLPLLMLFLLGGPSLVALGDQAAEEQAAKNQAAEEQQTEQAAGDAEKDTKQQDASKENAANGDDDGEKTKTEPDKTKPDTKPADKKQDKGPAGCPQPPRAKVECEPLKITVQLEGVFAGRRAEEISLEPEAWSQFEVQRMLDHGDVVQKGQVIFEFDPENIDNAIHDLEQEIHLAELGLDVARGQLKVLEKFTPEDIEIARRTLKETKADRRYVREVIDPLRDRMVEMELKMAEQAYDYQKEEYEQLKKMYEADELTEETEQIVLRRAKNALERAEFRLEQARLIHKRETEIDIERNRREREEQYDRMLARLKLSEESLPVSLDQSRLAVEQAEVALERRRQKLEELKADRELMTIKAPANGRLYFGSASDGQWDSATWEKKLAVGKPVPPQTVFATIVQTTPLVVETNVPEKHLHEISKGTRGKAIPGGFPDARLPARVAEIDLVPNGSGKFPATVRLGDHDLTERLLPGMNCKLKLETYAERRALVVSPKAVFSDDWDKDAKYVYLVRPGKEPKRQSVKIGRKTEKKVEILQGLREGDEILLECPKKKK